jgi:GAF domain-containing protein/anti-sigma regulatory factor (Ser/Thr protein kinase)
MRPQTRKRLSAFAFIVLVAAWPLMIALAITRSEFSAETVPAYVVFFLLTGLIWLALAVQAIRWMQRELTEALEQQTASADILKIISRTPFDLQVVLDTLVERAARLCEADHAAITRPRDDGPAHHHVAQFGAPSGYYEYKKNIPLPPGRDSVVGRVLLERRPVQIPDALADPEYTLTEAQRMGGYRTLLGVPLLRDGKVIGVVVLFRSAVRPFTEKHIELLTTFADKAVIAIENARLFDDVQARTRELTEALEQKTATAEILRVISTSPTNAQPVFDTIVRNAVALSGSQFANVFRFDGELLHYVASTFVGPGYSDLLQSKYPMRPDISQVSGRVILTKSIVRLEDVRTDLDYDQRFPTTMAWRRMLGVPMLRDGNPIGVIVVGWAESGPVPKAQEELLRTFADQAVIAIENARLFDEVQARTRELSEALEQQQAAGEILRVIARSPSDAQPVFETIAHNAARLCEAQYCNVFRRIEDKCHLVAANKVEAAQIQYLLANPVVIDRGSVTGRAAMEKRTIQVPDVLADPEFTRFEWQKIGRQRTVLGVPLVRDEELIGVIILARTEVEPFTERQVQLVTTFAEQAVIAIENARLFDEVQARTRELGEALQLQTTTADVLKVISRSVFDLRAVLDTLAESAAHLCEADAGAIARQRGELYYQVAHFGAPPNYDEFVRNRPLRVDRGSVVGRVLLEGRSVQIPDVFIDSEYSATEFQQATGFRTLLGVPLLREGKPIGVFVLWRRSVRPFTDKQLELLTTFADQAVIAIENARLFEEIQDKSRQLEIANKYKSHFLASASHDLRQPLHALNLFVAQLRNEADPAERDRLAERIDAAVSSMNELFGALLDMTKLDAGIIEPNLAEFAVERLFKRIETTFADAAREKGLRLRLVATDAWVRSDIILLERILLNLVSNAVRYSERGGVVIGCRRRGEALRIDVCDSGPGIPPDQRRNIFGEFYQISGADPKPRGGLGLGLAIVDRLVRLLHHTVEVDSQQGRGSRFSISVPVARRRGAAAVSISQAVPIDPVRGKSIVVVDDDPLVLDGMGGILRNWGCTVVAGESLEAVLASMDEKSRTPDLIISDYRLAGKSTGIDVVIRLRERFGSNVPAFLISGDTAPERLRDASEQGFHLLHKPVPPMQLRAMLNQLLRRPVEIAPAAE